MTLTLTGFHVASLIAAALALIVAAFSDARHYRIPNSLCLFLLLLFPFFVMTAPHEIQWQQHLMVFGLVLISGYAMFLGNLVGAGDIKLLASMGLWVGPHLIAVFIIMTALAGGVLALTMALLRVLRKTDDEQSVALSKTPIPYGIAIAIGGLCSLSQIAQPLLFSSQG